MTIYFWSNRPLSTVPKTEIERKKKQIVKVFNDCVLSIIIKCNLKSIDFLKVTFDLVNDIYKPYREPSNRPLYIDKHSNHPPNILKSFSGEYHVYQFIPLHSCDYLKKISIKINVAIDEGNGRNEWGLWVRIELMAW